MSRHQGFTLLELIGVIAVIAILSAVIAPSLFESIDDAVAKAEKANLETLADGLSGYSRQFKRLPSRDPADWAAAIAGQIAIPDAEVRVNRRGFSRALYFDPRFFTSSDSSFGGYAQTSGLVVPPISPRAILVSDLTRNAPVRPTTSSAFNAIWNQVPGASVVAGPKVHIQRVSFASLFHRVVLNNQNTGQPAYSLEGGSQVAIPAASGGLDGSVTRHVMDGTELRLYQAPFPGGGLETSSLIQIDRHYRYSTDGTNWFWARP